MRGAARWSSQNGNEMAGGQLNAFQRSPVLRVEGTLIAGIWFLGILASTNSSGRSWVPIVSLSLGLTTMASLAIPLRNSASDVPRTTSARRVTETTAALVLVVFLFRWGSPITVAFPAVAAMALASWIALSVSTALQPLHVTPWVPLFRSQRAWRPKPIPIVGRGLKRLIDLVGAVVLIALAAPILVVTTLAVRWYDRGQALFWQDRIGRNGKPFKMVKFRSMVPDAEDHLESLRKENARTGPLFKLQHDPRITPIGRFIRRYSIDELPQLFNVLRGEMSLVGPRPALAKEHLKFEGPYRARREGVKPGITGLWQAEARSDPEFNRYQELDMLYIRTWSPGLDIRILMATATEVLVTILAKPLSFFGIHAGGGESVVPSAVPTRQGDAVVLSSDGVVIQMPTRNAQIGDEQEIASSSSA